MEWIGRLLHSFVYPTSNLHSVAPCDYLCAHKRDEMRECCYIYIIIEWALVIMGYHSQQSRNMKWIIG